MNKLPIKITWAQNKLSPFCNQRKVPSKRYRDENKNQFKYFGCCCCCWWNQFSIFLIVMIFFYFYFYSLLYHRLNDLYYKEKSKLSMVYEISCTYLDRFLSWQFFTIWHFDDDDDACDVAFVESLQSITFNSHSIRKL